MRKKKETLPAPTESELNAVAKQLSNSGSVAILRHLYQAGFGLSSSIIRATGLSQSTVSKNLKALRQTNLITRECFRKCQILSINKDRFMQLGLSIEIWLANCTTDAEGKMNNVVPKTPVQQPRIV